MQKAVHWPLNRLTYVDSILGDGSFSVTNGDGNRAASKTIAVSGALTLCSYWVGGSLPLKCCHLGKYPAVGGFKLANFVSRSHDVIVLTMSSCGIRGTWTERMWSCMYSRMCGINLIISSYERNYGWTWSDQQQWLVASVHQLSVEQPPKIRLCSNRWRTKVTS